MKYQPVFSLSSELKSGVPVVWRVVVVAAVVALVSVACVVVVVAVVVSVVPVVSVVDGSVVTVVDGSVVPVCSVVTDRLVSVIVRPVVGTVSLSDDDASIELEAVVDEFESLGDGQIWQPLIGIAAAARLIMTRKNRRISRFISGSYSPDI